jgi:hypothetical protein
MEIESKIKDIRGRIRSLNQELVALLTERDALAYMSLSEDAIYEIYEIKPDLYSIKDLKVRYR